MSEEKNRMLAGDWFDPRDSELRADRIRIRKLVLTFNTTPRFFEDREKRHAHLRRMLGFLGNGSHIEPGTFACDYGYNIHLEDGASVNHGGIFLDCGRITIGAGTLVGPRVTILAVDHPHDEVAGSGRYCIGLPVTIGKKCWIGAGAIIHGGVTIGDNVVVAAGAVVRKDVPLNMVVGGVPARVLKGRAAKKAKD